LSVVAADVNRDGNLDLLVAIGSTYDISPIGVLLGKGDGTFYEAVTYGTVGTGAMALAVADVNADDMLDALIANSGFSPVGAAEAAVLLGNGDGTFQAGVNYDTNGSTPRAIGVADLNGDKLPDLVMTQCAVTGCGNGEMVAVLLHVGDAPTTTTLASSLNPSAYGKSITFTAEVQSLSSVPVGNVKFFDGSTELGSAMLVAGTATISTSKVRVGSRSITAVYQGSTRFKSSGSTVLTQVVYKTSTSVSLTSSRNPAFVRQSVAYTATVVSKFGGVITGYVLFTVSNGPTYTSALTQGKAVWNTSFSNIGARTVTAAYLGDANNLASNSTSLNQSVVFRTTMSLSSSPNPSFVGQAINLTANISSGSGIIPDGEVISFSDGIKIYGTAALKDGKASIVITSIPAGSRYIRATYVGDQTFSANFASIQQVVQRYPTSTAITANVNPSVIGQAVIFTATVMTSSVIAPSGWVTFKDGEKVVGVRALQGSKAVLTLGSLSAGTHSITARYAITPTWAPSNSAPLNQVVH
jgi:Bacterial Ig-like domain (group 3)/FG-GAP-like repeat